MFVWHSTSTEESGAALAAAIGCEHGTVPPQGYAGDVICYGASPATNFNWTSRNFGKIINDPRKIKKFKDIAKVVEVIGNANTGDMVRLFCVKGKVAHIQGSNFVVTPLFNTNIKNNFLSKLDDPDFVALDGIITKQGSFFLTKVVFGPAITETPDVLQKMIQEFGQEEVDDKMALQSLIDGASPTELKALRAVLKKLKD